MRCGPASEGVTCERVRLLTAGDGKSTHQIRNNDDNPTVY